MTAAAPDVGTGDAPAVSSEVEPQTSSSWRDALSDDIRNAPALANIDDIPTLAKAFVETKGFVGRKGVLLPKKDDPADVRRFFTELGVPEDPKGYDLSRIHAPEGVQIEPRILEGMKPILHKAGVTPEQAAVLAEGLLCVQGDLAKGVEADYSKLQEQSKQALQTKYGAAYETNLQIADAALKQIFPETYQDLVGAVLPSGGLLGDNPEFIDLLVEVGQGMAEDQSLPGMEPRRYTMTPEEASRKLAEFNLDKDKQAALFDADHPSHDEVVAERDGLYKAMYASSGG